ncbi:tripartite tricarboxylate transporter TctB family protein [Thioalkalivibrio sp. HK1]|uniref:tripartite tricarboxylate transporter TctB family protein n=1 Tax=Thioalkalivibrio sp. HK1 TaxID=1469245 RepID=UPI000571A1A4|nr:tripartite tricarboxylate transporter TctB family protein [Thioalkalivibrio sp. HK1]
MPRLGDRLFGLIVCAGALAYAVSALHIKVGFMSDPVGSKTFPLIVAGIAGLCGLIMIVRPDDDPAWPKGSSILSLGICIATLIGYALALKPGGFLLPTAIASGILSWQILPDRRLALIIGTLLSSGLFLIFKYLLGLSLFAFPRWILL